MITINTAEIIIAEVAPSEAHDGNGRIIIRSKKRPFGHVYTYPISPASRDRLHRLIESQEASQ